MAKNGSDALKRFLLRSLDDAKDVCATELVIVQECGKRKMSVRWAVVTRKALLLTEQPPRKLVPLLSWRSLEDIKVVQDDVLPDFVVKQSGSHDCHHFRISFSEEPASSSSPVLKDERGREQPEMTTLRMVAALNSSHFRDSGQRSPSPGRYFKSVSFSSNASPSSSPLPSRRQSASPASVPMTRLSSTSSLPADSKRADLPTVTVQQAPSPSAMPSRHYNIYTMSRHSALVPLIMVLWGTSLAEDEQSKVSSLLNVVLESLPPGEALAKLISQACACTSFKAKEKLIDDLIQGVRAHSVLALAFWQDANLFRHVAKDCLLRLVVQPSSRPSVDEVSTISSNCDCVCAWLELLLTLLRQQSNPLDCSWLFGLQHQHTLVTLVTEIMGMLNMLALSQQFQGCRTDLTNGLIEFMDELLLCCDVQTWLGAAELRYFKFVETLVRAPGFAVLPPVCIKTIQRCTKSGTELSHRRSLRLVRRLRWLSHFVAPTLATADVRSQVAAQLRDTLVAVLDLLDDCSSSHIVRFYMNKVLAGL